MQEIPQKQLRLVVYPRYLQGFIHPKVIVWDFFHQQLIWRMVDTVNALHSKDSYIYITHYGNPFPYQATSRNHQLSSPFCNAILDSPMENRRLVHLKIN